MTSQHIKILGISTTKNSQKYYFLLAAEKFGLQVRELEKLPRMQDGVLKERTVMQVSNGRKFILILGATTSQTSYVGMKIAVNKVATNNIFRKSGLPTTEQVVIHSEEDLALALSRFGKIIIKPADSRAGKGIFSNISTLKKAISVYKTLKKKYSIILAEKILEGKEYRILVINRKVFAVAEYVPPSITGDGIHTILSLIEKENEKKVALQKDYLIKINAALRLNLKSLGLHKNSILPLGKSIILHKAAPVSNGGYTIDVTSKIHPENIRVAEDAAMLINLDIAGIDVMLPDIGRPFSEGGGAIIEINGGPDFDVHFSVDEGHSKNGAEAVFQDYFDL
ncbi:MAG: hypothetical protein WDN67_02220 [Candidatus Moraniibacteriota bacterium]